MAKGVYVGVGSITYTELEYIQSTGTQYIDTGFVPNQDSGMELDFAVNAVDGNDNYLVGQRDTTTSKNFSFLVNAGGKFRFGYNTVVNDAGTADANRHTLKIEKNVLSMDGSEVVTATYAAFTGYGNMWICGINQTAGARYGKMKVYSCKLYDNSTLVRDFVPCQSSAGAIGLYDKVEGKFYANAGSGTFTAGTAGETIVTTGIAQKVKKMYVSPDGIARKVKKGYVGVGGVARPFFGSGELVYYGTITDLYIGRFALASTTIGNYALFGGGTNGSVNYSTVDAYTSTLTRSNPTDLLSSSQMLTATSNANYGLFAGGVNSSDSSGYSTVTAYNSTLTRSSAPDMSTKRRSLAATRVGNYALFGGGTTSGGSSHQYAVDTYNGSLTKSTATKLSVARRELAAATTGNYALFAGGRDASSNYTTVDTYNGSLTKSTATALSAGRYGLKATTVGDYALFTGGYGTAYSTAVDVYNKSLTKTTLALSTAKTDHAATTVGDFAIIAGGTAYSWGSNASAPANIVDVFDSSLTRMTTTNLKPERHELTATSVGNYALFSGGSNGSTCYKVVDAYTVV